MDDIERQQLTDLFRELLYRYEHEQSLIAINAAHDERNRSNPWVRLWLEGFLSERPATD